MKARAVGSLFLGLALAFNAHQRIESAERSASETGLVAGAQQRPDAFIPGVPTIVSSPLKSRQSDPDSRSHARGRRHFLGRGIDPAVIFR